MQIQIVKDYLRSLQTRITDALNGYESEKKFINDEWHHQQGGGGCSRVLEGGEVFEKAGVNFSHVQGDSLPVSATASRPELKGKAFQAMGVSLVIHPLNPYIPTTHMNVRYFNAGDVWWFGGGFDLTPYYPFKEDVIHWHRVAKKACDGLDDNYYSRFKKACDEYFYLKHRNETRGVGGLFFDDFNETDFDHSFAFMQSVGDHFLPAYLPIVDRRIDTPFEDHERSFQAYRRGRYVEFNLVYDRGTLFGLQSGGRTESILMSMPPVASWRYDWQADENSAEAKLDDYLKPHDWLAL